ncbi:uncharacterized protein LOC108095363 [Drosophila ficusphila]|uniref:uncharacterized protein LOC108095363 n=1 Tax=Drosophila ficusphila TaxID=30025 RepID=UPI0007E6E3E0|nr:uncharacterized protein LOC108095363 [Drosophila ficusphila]
MDGDKIRESSSDQELEYSKGRRNGIHYASIAEFLASLNVNDTSLNAVRGLNTLSLEDYLKTMRCAEKKSGDGDIAVETKKIQKKSVQVINRRRLEESNSFSKSQTISQYPEKIWI